MSIRSSFALSAWAIALACGSAAQTAGTDGSTGSGDTGTAEQTVEGDLQPMTYAPAQSVAGRLLYMRQCSECHGRDLGGSAAPSLVGSSFSYRIGRPVAELHDYIQDFMPVTDPGSLTDAQVTALIAYLAEQNGHDGGGEAMPAESEAQAGISFAQ